MMKFTEARRLCSRAWGIAQVRRELLVGVILVATGQPAVGQTVDATPSPSDTPPAIPESSPLPVISASSELERMVAFAISQHPELSWAAADVSREVGLRIQSTRKPNPWVGYAGTEIGNEGRAGQQGIYVSQEWITAGKRGLADYIGSWRTRAAEERRELARLRVARRVGTQYWMLVAARRRVELLTELETLLQDAVRVNQSLEEAAEVDRGTVLQAQLEKGQVVASKRQAEADLRARSAALAATLGVDVPFIDGIASDPWPEPRTLMSPSNSASLDLMVGEPYLASPELTEAHALIEAARCELRLAETQIISNVDSFASVQQDTATDDTIVSMQIGMALPVHDRKTGLVRAARADLAKLESEFARRERDLAARWAAATGEYQSAWELVRAIEEELLTTAEQRFELARRAQQQGEINYLELLLAQRSFLAVREAALVARQQAAIAAVRLEALVVEDTP